MMMMMATTTNERPRDEIYGEGGKFCVFARAKVHFSCCNFRTFLPPPRDLRNFCLQLTAYNVLERKTLQLLANQYIHT